MDRQCTLWVLSPSFCESPATCTQKSCLSMIIIIICTCTLRIQYKHCRSQSSLKSFLKEELLNQSEFVLLYRSNIIGSGGLFTVFVTIDSSACVYINTIMIIIVIKILSRLLI